jgi:hypothetical protein
MNPGYVARNAVNNCLAEIEPTGLDHRTRVVWCSVREALLICVKADILVHEALIVALRGVETYLGMPLSIPPKERRL